MRFTFTKSHSRRTTRQSAEGGYVLLMMILMVALLTIAAAAIAPSIAFQVKRDREEEMVHRGTQYSRAIQHFYKKFNRYPTKIEDLEDTNNIRFLRKRYKDPISGKDFKLLYLSDVQAALAGGATGGPMPGANGGPAAGNQPGQPGSIFGGPNPGAGPAGIPSTQSANAAGGPAAGAPGSSGQSASGTASAAPSQPGSPSDASSGDKLTGQTFGGGPIAGVASISKAQTIREYNKKDHYNEWLFLYDPQSDRGGLINTPYQPALVSAIPMGQTGAPGSPGMPAGLGNQGLGNQASPFGGMQQAPPNVQPQQQPQRQ